MNQIYRYDRSTSNMEFQLNQQEIDRTFTSAMDPVDFFTIRIQFLADTDPFNCLSMYPLPSRAPVYAFVYTAPLATQLGSVLRLLGAPQRVRVKIFSHYLNLCCCFSPSIWWHIGEKCSEILVNQKSVKMNTDKTNQKKTHTQNKTIRGK